MADRSGRPNSALLASLITDRALCSECLAGKVGLSVSDAMDGRQFLRGLVRVTDVSGRCDACLEIHIVHTLGAVSE